MATDVSLGLLSLGGAPHNNAFLWISNDVLVYAGLSDICIARNVDSTLVPEEVLSVLSKTIFRSLRKIHSNNESQPNEGFELIATSLDGHVRIISCKKSSTPSRWRYSILLDVLISPDELIDSFGFRCGDQLSIIFATFRSIQYWRICGEQIVKQKMAALTGSPMINCIYVHSLPSDAFLILFALTNKKIGVRILKSDVEEDSEFTPVQFDSRESVLDLDVRLDKNAEKGKIGFELLAGAQTRVHIYKLSEGQLTDEELKTGSLESRTALSLPTSLIVQLDTNIYVSDVERISSVRWDNQNDCFAVCTRENSLKIYSLDKSTSTELWVLKREVCAFGEPALELCGIFDATFSPSSKYLIAHNTIGGFYFFEHNDENSFNPVPTFIGGHGGKVRNLTWHQDGNVLLTVGADKSCRYFAKYPNGSWGQRSRPQVHGHQIRCIASLGSSGFVSGAAEHMFRVYSNTIPKMTIEEAIERIQPLNLTPKPQTEAAGDQTNTQMDEEIPASEELLQSGAKVHEERKKLYGHGNECYSVAALPTGELIFTAAKGSRPDEAQLIVWATADGSAWRIAQRLQHHQLTITALSVSPNAEYLLSVSRDRSLNLYSIDKTASEPLHLIANLPNAHKRVIWTAAWLSPTAFLTGSRDGFVAAFRIQPENPESPIVETDRWKVGECVSAMDVGCRQSDGALVLVAATESGQLHVVEVDSQIGKIKSETMYSLSREDGIAFGSTVFALRYNPQQRIFAACSESGVLKTFAL